MAKKYPPPSPPFIRARRHGGRQTPKAIVMHGTVSSDNAGTARNIARWWNGPGSPASSCHYVVDPAEVIQCVGDHTVAYHCGYNTGSIGVELCDEQTGPASRWEDADSQAILRRAARLVAELCLAYGISPKRPSIAELKRKGPHGIYGHNDSRLAFGRTTHTDPRDFNWPRFIRMVNEEIAGIKGAGKRKPGRVKITIINRDFNRGGDKAFLSWAKKWARAGILAQVEVGHGKNSTRIRGLGKRVLKKVRRAYGKYGAHRWGVFGRIKLGKGKRLRVLVIHGLHVRSQSKARQLGQYDRVRAKTEKWTARNIPWAVVGDHNMSTSELAEILDGIGVRAPGSGVMGAVHSRDLEHFAVKVDNTPIDKNWSDHPAVQFKLRRK